MSLISFGEYWCSVDCILVRGCLGCGKGKTTDGAVDFGWQDCRCLMSTVSRASLVSHSIMQL